MGIFLSWNDNLFSLEMQNFECTQNILFWKSEHVSVTNCIIHLHVAECPPVLFEVKCQHHSLVLGGIPYHYIICPPGKQGEFHVYSVKNNSLVSTFIAWYLMLRYLSYSGAFVQICTHWYTSNVIWQLINFLSSFSKMYCLAGNKRQIKNGWFIGGAG